MFDWDTPDMAKSTRARQSRNGSSAKA